MKVSVKWNEGMSFDAQAGENTVSMDAKPPLGKSQGPTPKEFIAMGLGGCTAMDVISILRKHKQLPIVLDVTVDTTSSEQGHHPVVFTEALITFSASGEVDPEVLMDAVRRSQTLYCGVSAMLKKSFPIRYVVKLNGQEVGSGEANFENQNKQS